MRTTAHFFSRHVEKVFSFPLALDRGGIAQRILNSWRCRNGHAAGSVLFGPLTMCARPQRAEFSSCAASEAQTLFPSFFHVHHEFERFPVDQFSPFRTPGLARRPFGSFSGNAGMAGRRDEVTIVYCPVPRSAA